jgi:HEXXH motif-containing protein
MNVRLALIDSLEYIIDAARLGELDSVSATWRKAKQRIEAHRVSPSVFARYYEIVRAVETGDAPMAARLFSEIAALVEDERQLRSLPFDRVSLGDDFDRYGEIVSARNERLLISPDHARWTEFNRCVNAAFALLDATDASLASEVRALVLEIIGACAAGESSTPSFGGASSFMLWGAIFLNVDRHQTALDALEGVVHEATHQLLFGLFHREPFVANASDELFVSPLRPDPRPMDGVFHATFVCARLNYLYRRLRAVRPSSLSPADLACVERRIEQQRARFLGGFATIEKHALLTPVGRDVIEAAHAYVLSGD